MALADDDTNSILTDDANVGDNIGCSAIWEGMVVIEMVVDE